MVVFSRPPRSPSALPATATFWRPKFFTRFKIFGVSIEDVLKDPRWQGAIRDLDVVELESGVEAVTRAGRGRGHRAHPFDIKRDPVHENVLLEAGFFNAVGLVMRLRVGGLLGQAPVCSSWVGLNSANTKRNRENFAGDEDYEPVQVGNRMADASFFLMGLALAREVHTYLENPAGSMIFSYGMMSTSPGQPGILQELAFLQRSLQYRCRYSDHEKHTIYRKPYKFLVSGSWLPDVKCACLPGTHESLARVTVHGVGRAQKKRYSGKCDHLQASQSYPDPLGDFIIASWEGAAPVPRFVQQPLGSQGEAVGHGGALLLALPAIVHPQREVIRKDVWTSAGGLEDPWAMEAPSKNAEDPWLQAESPLSAEKAPASRKRPVPKHLRHLALHMPNCKKNAAAAPEDPWEEVDSGMAGLDLDPWGASGW